MSRQSTEENREAVRQVARSLLSKLDGPNDKWIVPVYGAGASINSGVPSGNYLMQTMRQILLTEAVETDRFRRTFREEAAKKLAALQNPRRLYFEEVLDIYSQMYGSEELYGWLRNQICQPKLRYFPTFTHEYCAHLVAGGFLKYFLSANFDEILEHALEDELGPGTFHTVASLSEFKQLANSSRNQWDSEVGPYRTRCYVFKPHGTISRSLSLRHLPRTTESFESAKIPVLKEVLKDSVLLLLGFGNYNHDYWELFIKTVDRGDTDNVIIVDRKPKDVRRKFADARVDADILCYEGTTDNFFVELAKALHADNGLAKRQKPTRHEIRSMFFGLFSRHLVKPEDKRRNAKVIRTLMEMHDCEPSWFAERIYELELLIYLFKTRGLFIDLAAADCKRVRTAYDRCLENKIDRDLRVPSVLKEILNRDEKPLVENSLVADRRGQASLNTQWCYLVTSENRSFGATANGGRTFLDASKAFSSWVRHKLPSGLKGRVGPNFTRALAGYLRELSQSFDIDITEQHRTTAMRFRAPQIVKSRGELSRYTSRILDPRRWDLLRVASVAGEWLASELSNTDFDDHFVGDRVIVVLGNLDVLTTKYAERRQYRPRELFHFQNMVGKIATLLRCLQSKSAHARSRIRLRSFALANLAHHMTVSFLVGEPREGVYFSRIGKNTSVSPVLLQNEHDVRDLAKYFDTQTSVASLMFDATTENGDLKVQFNQDQQTVIEDIALALKARGISTGFSQITTSSHIVAS